MNAFCVMSENLFVLFPLVVLGTGALLAGKLPVNLHIFGVLKIGFYVMSENFIPSFTSFTHLLCYKLVPS